MEVSFCGRFMPGKRVPVTHNSALVGPRIRSVCFREEQYLLHLPGIEEPRFLGCPASDLVTTVVTLFRLLIQRFEVGGHCQEVCVQLRDVSRCVS